MCSGNCRASRTPVRLPCGCTVLRTAKQCSKAAATGAFRFTTTLLPANCVGILSDGAQSLSVVVQGCGPAGATSTVPLATAVKRPSAETVAIAGLLTV